jgi:UDP-glucose 4-epimerase
MKSAIVTGATGMIGSVVANYLANNGIKTLALGRNLGKIDFKKFGVQNNLKFVEIPMTNIHTLEDYIWQVNWDPTDCVFFNFAWRGKRNLTDGTLNDQMKNVAYTSNSIKVAKKLGCIKFVNCGTLQESFAQRFILEGASSKKLSQFNYTIAKVASRDIAKIESYMSKLDYVHTRVSVPLSLDLKQKSYIHSSLKRILEGVSIDRALNNNIFDFIRIEELAHAYLLIGEKGINKTDYYIGSRTPATINRYFSNFKKFIQDNQYSSYDRLDGHNSDLFDTSQLTIDTGFRPSESFNVFMSEAVAKWRKLL